MYKVVNIEIGDQARYVSKIVGYIHFQFRYVCILIIKDQGLMNFEWYCKKKIIHTICLAAAKNLNTIRSMNWSI